MTYTIIKENDVKEIALLYLDYYNNYECGCWTIDKAYKRIHQIVTIEDSYSLLQKDDNGKICGFAIGYFKEYDDLKCYYLEEIVIFKEFQNKGYGYALLNELERRVLEFGIEHIELLSMNDEHHMHFYHKFQMYEASNLKVMGKHYKLK